MSHPWFRFKHFTIYQERSGMKVGTDGVLLGAWVDVTKAKKILDVGTGTGLIALMLAQRSKAQITGLDNTKACYEEAWQNFQDSPWRYRLLAIHSSYQEYVQWALQEGIHFDLVVSNPPFYSDSKKPEDRTRAAARHTVELSFTNLLNGCNSLLSKNGHLAVIYPAGDYLSLLEQAEKYHYFPTKVLRVVPKPGAQEKRILIDFCRIRTSLKTDSLIIESGGRHKYSVEYKKLTRDFYLNF